MASLKPCFLKPLKKGLRERSPSQEGSVTEASAVMVSYRSSSERGLSATLQQGPVLATLVRGTESFHPLKDEGQERVTLNKADRG